MDAYVHAVAMQILMFSVLYVWVALPLRGWMIEIGWISDDDDWEDGTCV